MNQRRISIPDLILASTGVLALIATLLPWWAISTSASIAGQKVSDHVTVNAWNAASHGELGKTITGPLAWIPMLLLLLLGTLALVRALAAPHLLPGKIFYQVGAGIGALAAISVAMRWVTYFKPPSTVNAGDVAASATTGASLGTYLGLLLGLAAAGDGIWALSRPELNGRQPAASDTYPGPLGGSPQPDYGQQPQLVGYPQQVEQVEQVQQVEQVEQAYGPAPSQPVPAPQPPEGYQQPPAWQ